MDQEKKIQELELEVQKLKSRIRIDKKEMTYQEQLVFLSNTALDFLSHSEHPDLFEYIGKKLLGIVDNSVVIISSFEPVCNELTIRYIGGIEGMLDKVEKILGRRPGQMKVRLTEKTTELLREIPNKLHRFREGFYESSDGTISRPVAKALERLIHANEMYGIVFERNGQIFGTATLITRGKARVDDPQLIEAFIFQSSIALHRQLLENELIVVKKQADHSNKLKTAFLANMSHEIRTPMNGILGLTSLLSDPGIDPDTHREYVDLISSSGNVLLNLLDGIMDISRIEANQVILNRESFNLNKLFNELKNYYHSELILLGKKEIEIETVVSFDKEDAWITADQVKIRQILVNLIGNAIKFTDRGKIEFGYKFRKNKNQLLFHVSDTGPGIKKELREVIFEQFIQGDYSSTREYRGSGLGLAIIKGFLDLMDGKIWLKSVTGKGSTFFFTLPYAVKRDPLKGTSEPGLHQIKRNWKKYRILIVEDDYINYKLLEGVLKRSSARIIHSATGREAVKICRGKEIPDLVLMDLQLPGMSGFETIAEIRESNPDLPIIVQTANALHGEKKKAEELGCQGFILKPVNLDNFLNEVGKYLVES
jgi:signal transduction histidine kinase/CheY-like chemotaxis protein